MDFFTRFKKYLDPKSVAVLSFGLVLLYRLGKSFLFSDLPNSDYVKFSTLISDLQAKKVKSAQIGTDIVEYLVHGSDRIRKSRLIPNYSSDRLISDLNRSGADISARYNSDNVISTILVVVLPMSYLALLYFMLKHLTPSNTSLKVSQSSSAVRLTDIAGMDDVKLDMLDIIDFLKNPAAYNSVGARLPRGVILSGNPGVGKSMLARALANECQIPFFMTCGSGFVDLYVGRGASNIRNLFDSARKSGPFSIVFIDEIDAIGKSRGGLNSHDEREQSLNQLLFEMDSDDVNSKILVIGATNRIDVLDHALLRAGRFDRHLHINDPNHRDRIEIFRCYLNKTMFGHHSDDEIGELAGLTDGLTGSSIESIVNDACLLACRNRNDDDGDDNFRFVKLAIERRKFGIKYN